MRAPDHRALMTEVLRVAASSSTASLRRFAAVGNVHHTRAGGAQSGAGNATVRYCVAAQIRRIYDPFLCWEGLRQRPKGIPLAREQRKLAAIMAADVVGYARLMGRDEAGTLLRLKKWRSDCLEPSLARNGGRIVKLTGDGVLAEFASVVDALRGAVEFQQASAELNAALADAEPMVFRVGIHLGDLIVEGNDLYGDGVNVAARLEPEAPPGGIVISRAVRDAVAGKLKTVLRDLGAQRPGRRCKPDRPRTRRALYPRRQHPPGRQPRPHHRPAHRGGAPHPYLGRPYDRELTERDAIPALNEVEFQCPTTQGPVMGGRLQRVGEVPTGCDGGPRQAMRRRLHGNAPLEPKRWASGQPFRREHERAHALERDEPLLVEKLAPGQARTGEHIPERTPCSRTNRQRSLT